MGIKLVPTLVFQIPNQGEHKAQIVSYEEVEGLNPDWGKQYLFKVKINVDGVTMEHYHYTSQKFNSATKLGEMVESILGVSLFDYGDENPFDLDDILFVSVKVFIKHEERDGKKRAVIQAWFPIGDKDDDVAKDDDIPF